MSNTPHASMEALIVWATPDAQKADLIVARAQHLAMTGEVFEDDKQVVQRMATFLEWYACDRVAPWLTMTPARARYLHALHHEDAAAAAAYRALTETVHSLFEVIALAPQHVEVRDVLTDVTSQVVERRQLVGLKRGDVIEARLIPHHDGYHFSPTWCFHPHEAAAAIRLEARRLRSHEVARSSAQLVADCAQRSLKADRYRQIAVERIYDFKNTTL